MQCICVKWGEKYNAECVNRLHSMLRKQLSRPFTLHCITDNSEGIDADIVTHAPKNMNLTGWWLKLSIFDSDLYNLNGDILYLDLDVVIVDNIDAMFDYMPGEFLISGDLQTGEYNSSVFRLPIGSQAMVWNSFIKNQEEIIAQYHGDQDWISLKSHQAVLWPNEWVVSFKKQCNARIKRSWGLMGKLLRHLGLMKVSGEAIIPAGSKIIQFHGKPDPDDVVEKPYGLYKKAPWIKQYWY